MRPPGPLAESKRVTEIPFLARVAAQTAPETVKLKFSMLKKGGKTIINCEYCINRDEKKWVIVILLPLPTTATLVTTSCIPSHCCNDLRIP